MQIWIGTSGYSYSGWVGAFYPSGTKAGRMLAYYCRSFPLVELNYTFYRMPTAEQLLHQAEQTPAGFQFLVKLPQTLSHDTDGRDLLPFRQALTPLRERGQLLGLLCQLPQAVHNTAEARAWIERLANELGGDRLAIEFRHRSWTAPDVPPWLAQRGLDLVSVDVPNLPGLYPTGLVQSSATIYVRFHSRNAGNWYASDKEHDRYDYDYTDAELTGWIDTLKSTADKAARALLLFNNCHRAQAVQNARRMRELIKQLAPAFELVEPLALAAPEQRQLFE